MYKKASTACKVQKKYVKWVLLDGELNDKYE